ncbi:MAG: divalent-cation tolerance protein CutA [Sulfurimonas sp.]|nr:MAG: divalent-cation tolerance protein CutA [Sulfurimonas sp.]
MSYCLIITTCKDEQEATILASSILELKLAACVQLSHISSLYTWQNKLVNDNEVKLSIKTKKSLYKKLKEYILQNHSYDTPEIIMININKGSKKYLNWIKEVTI